MTPNFSPPRGGAQREPRVVIAHDYLTQRGGAERVVLALLGAFPNARVVTVAYWPDGTFPEFAKYDIRTSTLGRIPALRTDPRRAFPFLALAWNHIEVKDADVVICSSSGWSHGVTTSAPKIVYCHNPARWLYQADEYLQDRGILARAVLSTMRPSLTRWDGAMAATAQLYLANSTVVAERVRCVYGREALIVHPPASLPNVQAEPLPGIEPGFLLTVGRPRGYKNTDVVTQAVASLPGERLVAVGGLPPGKWPESLVGMSGVSDAQLCWLYQNAAALVACSYEDFGLTPIEAFSMGTPVIALRAGGYLDTMVPGMTGEFVDDLSRAAVVAGIRRMRESSYDKDKIKQHAEEFSTHTFAARMRAAVDEVLDKGQSGHSSAGEPA